MSKKSKPPHTNTARMPENVNMPVRHISQARLTSSFTPQNESKEGQKVRKTLLEALHRAEPREVFN